ncbi:aminopeptidase P family protein [Candidatus Methylacidiphilum infernorum]|uniref:Aminopeptidase P family protein n=1 Tax=Candidatus Methylacidiphilum infernorum TaxID=511746 RepID=A0ABX7PY48_9BACT|nr:Xaa-Pro peptidase family protein [Candidatus Methylacidiphilum infernorum]QSR87588.1 aminopeptidase P family protein [Candidatus Methylacidiphilum infernorum]
MARMMFAASEKDANMLYATRMMVPDPFLWIEVNSKSYIFLSKLEIDRAKREAKADVILSYEEACGIKEEKLTVPLLIKTVCKKLRVSRLQVPSNFPLGLAEALRKQGLNVIASKKEFFPERSVKTPAEIEAIRSALRIAEKGMQRAMEVLKESKITAEGLLLWQEKILDSKILREEIEIKVLREGATATGTIVACGIEACDPHEVGKGKLRANQAIVIDIFPRDRTTGYYGDLSRTVVKGEPSKELFRLYATVKEGKQWVLSILREGLKGKNIEKELRDTFTRKGYPTEMRGGRWVGFFHGLGHGVGLEIHEPPRFRKATFKKNQVLTVEPGLYYPEIGGVRLEDMVVIKEDGVENLTQIEEVLEIA